MDTMKKLTLTNGGFTFTLSIDKVSNGGIRLLNLNLPVLEFDVYINFAISIGGVSIAKFYARFF
jgi:hypothetical protein